MEDINEMIKLYNEGLGSYELSKKFNITPKKIRTMLKNAGIQLRCPGPVNTSKAKKLEKEMAEMYASGISSEKIAEKFGLDGGTVRRAIKRQGVEIRPSTENKRIYELNDTWLDKIDSENKAYFYGFMLTDGSVDKDENSFKLSLNIKDEHILREFAMILYGFEKIDYKPYKVESGETHMSANLRVYSIKFTKRLIELGCGPAKTFITKYPEWMPEYLHRHFIRGLIDGDGCVYLSKDEKSARLLLTGTVQLLESVQEILKLNITGFKSSIKLETPERNNIIATLTISNLGVVKRTLDWLYKDAVFYLKRKFNNYQKIIKQFYNIYEQEYSKDQIDKIFDLFNEGSDSLYISKETGISPIIVQRFLERLGYSEEGTLEKEIIKLYESGYSTTKIAEYLDIGVQTVCRRLKENNIEIRSTAENKKKIFLQPITKAVLFDNKNVFSDDIIIYNGIALTKEKILSMSIDEKEILANDLFILFRKRGFPYPKFEEQDLINDYNSLTQFDINNLILENQCISVQSNIGTKLFKSYFPHFYESKRNDNLPSLVEGFFDDDILKKVIRNRLGITWNETFNITENMIRQGLRNAYLASHVSVFKPTLAKFIYEKFAPDNGIIYDYSSGFGQRMLGALSSNKNLTYIGCDPYKKNIDSSIELAKFLGQERRIQMHAIGSENFCPNELHNKVDLAFSSPPYFSTEIYCNELTQAYYNCTYIQFITEWWQIVCSNLNKLIKPDGLMILNIAEKVDKYNIMHDMTNELEKFGFKQIDRYNLQLIRKKDKNKTEPLIIFKRQ